MISSVCNAWVLLNLIYSVYEKKVVLITGSSTDLKWGLRNKRAFLSILRNGLKQFRSWRSFSFLFLSVKFRQPHIQPPVTVVESPLSFFVGLMWRGERIGLCPLKFSWQFSYLWCEILQKTSITFSEWHWLHCVQKNNNKLIQIYFYY